ncbi:acyl-CoA thioesterase [Aureimonas frigidaquae]|uniref:Acyl-CoA thioesterase 2 n=1 Tax=Aureimonas frigidaquae TaxID=424757 RepID=A0A0P0Z0J3_9HYPH|nr:acyl-CoA thioesterase II [Aureimonas frigidaquae]BAT27228.1 acyl-CoA thioesterase [Aureimonas frigidaquae]
MQDAVATLLTTLDLERLEDDLFRGVSPDAGWQRVFGGQVVAQALVAAQRTVPDSRPVHSLHGTFLRPGDPAIPIVYSVIRLRDGGSFTTRNVTALQHGKAIFVLTASFQALEEGFSHQIPMPEVAGPDDIDHAAWNRIILEEAPEPVRRYWQRPRPVEFRPVSLDHYLSDRKLPPHQAIWVRLSRSVPADPARDCAILAYLSDMTLLDTALFAHGLSVFDKRVQAASLDHSMWFHRPVHLDDWLLYVQDSPSSSGGRGLTRGALFARDGTLIASVAQEGLIRPRKERPAQ